ncbi:carboxyvinyl-carboxyphosphonate phosphorylmutase [Paraburkholderia graminis]|jgi:2-methylisocitrate lyase-like PEP mutase family enzyme|uniref:2-methylisocitrate lyase-like PEP mutase family enzyme n=1 Tax=Paraburkholderia graminis TaxID=60548 RepID=A0ABD5CN17_9BURK|nr:oxaloacetate decarboxylase [Paraburkholderia graminis]AXF10782.1 carboxyvinyl-carboxyphosphonate phosphorylmutase [Paraburkholderia graminis]MDQ0625308.1 2-methylisocitrate lyase-like PEP mutase family enzyme [Paraburkholderia graminis]MDR6206466.1 2-methylisocitrate lyase-like PEP mutase family enzyme [Paraburkholderia graminis]MDR6469986.1 2-methylisocitrate lyase-like PEP mutase family enzyme [Paraburkholderia graminis]
MTTSATRRAAFRAKVNQRQGLLVPGAFNAMSARVIEDAGFEAIYITGAGVTNMSLGLPDLGFIGLAEVAEHTARIRDAVALPLIVDADTGFGNALNVRQTVRVLERSGADVIQFEDQIMPKKCGHFSGKEVIGASEMAGKIRAAVDAREDGNLQIMARTDAAAVHGIEDAIERGHRFIEAGADILFIEATESLADIERLPSLFDAPQLINIVIGGKTPVQSREALGKLGYGIVLYANAALQGAVLGMQRALGSLQTNGRLDEDATLVAPFSERQRLVNKPLYDRLDREYAAKD